MYINHYWHFRFKYRVNSVIDCVCAWFVVCFFVIKRVELRPFRYGYCIVATYCVQLFTIILHITTAQLFLVDILSWIIYMENERKRAKKGARDGERTWTINAYEHQLAWQKLVNNLLQLLLSISYEKRCERANLFDIWYEYFDRFEWSGRYSILFNHLNIRSLYPSASKW